MNQEMQKIAEQTKIDFPDLFASGKVNLPTEEEVQGFIKLRSNVMGKQFVLWAGDFSDEAYRDQYGTRHRGFIITQEVLVTVIELRMVPGDYSEKWHYGLKAKGDDGNEYLCHWDTFPECSSNPGFFWESAHTKAPWEWHDANYLFRSERCANPDGTVAVPKGWKQCTKHPRYIYNPEVNEYEDMGATEPGCFGCLLDTIKPVKATLPEEVVRKEVADS